MTKKVNTVKFFPQLRWGIGLYTVITGLLWPCMEIYGYNAAFAMFDSLYTVKIPSHVCKRFIIYSIYKANKTLQRKDNETENTTWNNVTQVMAFSTITPQRGCRNRVHCSVDAVVSRCVLSPKTTWLTDDAYSSVWNDLFSSELTTEFSQKVDCARLILLWVLDSV